MESHTLELPAGYVKENELPEEAIIREFKEETGFVCNSIKFLGSLRIAPSRINNMLYVYFSQNAEITDTVDKDQKTNVILVTKDEFNKMIMEGKFVEMAGIAIYYIALEKGFL